MGGINDKNTTGLIGTPTRPFLNNTSIAGESINGSVLGKTPIRPLTAAYQAATNEQQVHLNTTVW